MSQTDPVVRAELEVAETIGQLMHFWGFKRPMGRMWTVLYLSPDPLGAAELGDRLHMSAGAVSMNLNALLKWGAIRRTWRPGERRDYYECETSVWKLVRRVLRERELTLVRDAKGVLDRALAVLTAKQASSAAPDLGFKRDRIASLQRLAGWGELLLGALDVEGPVEPAVLRAAVEPEPPREEESEA